LEALGINLPFLLVQIVNLIIVYTVIAKWIVGPIGGLLEKRRENIAQGLEDARVAAEARANAEKEAARIIADAQAEAGKVSREATERAERIALEIKAGAEEEVVKAREGALADLEIERTRLLGDLRSQVAALSIAATQKLLGVALDEKRQHALLDDFFSGVKSGKVKVLENVNIKGASAEVTSALPLTDKEQTTVKKEVLAKVDAKAVTFHVDPALLGGLVIRVGDKVVDGSVAGQLDNLRQSIK
jgi:F-type H+-transporting ATPase subunit b